MKQLTLSNINNENSEIIENRGFQRAQSIMHLIPLKTVH